MSASYIKEMRLTMARITYAKCVVSKFWQKKQKDFRRGGIEPPTFRWMHATTVECYCQLSYRRLKECLQRLHSCLHHKTRNVMQSWKGEWKTGEKRAWGVWRALVRVRERERLLVCREVHLVCLLEFAKCTNFWSTGKSRENERK